MADLQGWKYDYVQDTMAVILALDATEGLLQKVSDASTSPMTVTTCGAGEVPVGASESDVDISEDGTRSTVVRNGWAPLTAAAAVTDATLPLKAAASGQVTPVTTDKDVIVGYPLHTASSGSIVLVDLNLMGSFYTV